MLVIQKRRVATRHERGVAAFDKLDRRRAAHRQIQLPAERQQGVAELFCGQSLSVLSPQPAIVRIDLGSGAPLRGLLPGGTAEY